MQTATLSWQIDGSDCSAVSLRHSPTPPSPAQQPTPVATSTPTPSSALRPMPMPMAVTVAARFVCAAAVLHEYA